MKALICDFCGKVIKNPQKIKRVILRNYTADFGVNDRFAYKETDICMNCVERIFKKDE